MAFRFKESNWREPPKQEPKWYEKLWDAVQMIAVALFLLLVLSFLLLAQVGGFK